MAIIILMLIVAVKMLKLYETMYRRNDYSCSIDFFSLQYVQRWSKKKYGTHHDYRHQALHQQYNNQQLIFFFTHHDLALHHFSIFHEESSHVRKEYKYLKPLDRVDMSKNTPQKYLLVKTKGNKIVLSFYLSFLKY